MSKIYTSEEVSNFLDSVSPERRDELLAVSGIPWSNLLSAAIEKAKPFPLKKTQP